MMNVKEELKAELVGKWDSVLGSDVKFSEDDFEKLWNAITGGIIKKKIWVPTGKKTVVKPGMGVVVNKTKAQWIDALANEETARILEARYGDNPAQITDLIFDEESLKEEVKKAGFKLKNFAPLGEKQSRELAESLPEDLKVKFRVAVANREAGVLDRLWANEPEHKREKPASIIGGRSEPTKAYQISEGKGLAQFSREGVV